MSESEIQPKGRGRLGLALMIMLALGLGLGSGAAITLLMMKKAPPKSPAVPESNSAFSEAERLHYRTALEQLRYELKAGPGAPPFSQVMTGDMIAQALALDAKKERLLRERCGIAISDQMIGDEVDRMKKDYEHPELILKIADALDRDPRAIIEFWVMPILVDRYLRACVSADADFNAEAGKKAQAGREMISKKQTAGLKAERVTLNLEGQETAEEDRSGLIGLSPGQTSPVIEAPFDFHVFQVVSKQGNTLEADKFEIAKPGLEDWLKDRP